MLGAVQTLQDEGMLDDVRIIVGTSAGALVGAMLAAGIVPNDALAILKQYKPDFDVGRLAAAFGIDSGKALDAMFSQLFGTMTFEELRRARGISLVVVVTNLTMRRGEYLCADTNPGMPVALALRMSCSVPLYFASVTYRGCVYVDGCVIDNFPYAYATTRPGVRSALGIAFDAPRGEVTSFDTYVSALTDCMLQPSFQDVKAPILRLAAKVRSLDFSAELDMLYASGQKQAAEYIKKCK